MKKLFVTLALLILTARCAAAEVLIVADEFPAMQVLTNALLNRAKINSQLTEQTKLPVDLSPFQAVVVYIHKGLNVEAEHAFIQYAEKGGRLVLLHHSISSGKRQNQDWFRFLGVELPEGDAAQGGYKWIEGVTAEWFDLSPNAIMTNGVTYPSSVSTSGAPTQAARLLPTFTLHETEVYLNHVLHGPRTLLMGLKYTDQKTGQIWQQDTAGWMRPAGQGLVLYFMPGHSLHDFQDPTYLQIVLNAITMTPESAIHSSAQ